MTIHPAASSTEALLRRGQLLEIATLAWNVAGIGVLTAAVVSAHSVALAGFDLDSLIEIGASLVVLWELADRNQNRQLRALRLIRAAFLLLAAYLLTQSAVALATDFRPQHSPLGIGWTAATALVMTALAARKRRTGAQLGNPVLLREGRVTAIDAVLACVVLVGVSLSAAIGWWWADPIAGLAIVYYALREAISIQKDASV